MSWAFARKRRTDAIEIRATLVVGCDGRDSDVREKAGLAVETLGAPMDVLWFRLSSKPADSQQTGGVFLPGRIFVTLNRGDYWQCAYVIPKGSLEEVRRRGLEAFRSDIAQAVPDFADRVRRDRRLGPRQAAHRRGRSAQSLAQARPALHRRRRARHVADRRRRGQSRGAGRGRGGEHPGRAAAQRRGHRCGAAIGAGSPRPSRPARPSGCSSSCRTTSSAPCCRTLTSSMPPLLLRLLGPLSAPAPPAGAAPRPRLPARAHPHA